MTRKDRKMAKCKGCLFYIEMEYIKQFTFFISFVLNHFLEFFNIWAKTRRKNGFKNAVVALVSKADLLSAVICFM